jgi:hypothetical protein
LVFLPGSSFLKADSDSAFAKVDAGLEYIHRRIGKEPWSIHIIKIDRSNNEFSFVSTLARDTIFGLASLRDQIQSLDPQLGQPVAAVNGDFFRIRPGPYQGDPLGLQILEGELVSSPRGASFWTNAKGKPRISEVRSKFKAAMPNGKVIPFEINQERLPDQAVLYLPMLGPSTRTTDGIELILQKQTSPSDLTVGMAASFRVGEIYNKGDNACKADEFILSIGPELLTQLGPIEKGAAVQLKVETVPDLTSVKTAIAGGPILLKDSKKVELKRKPVRHPRTALGWNKDSFFLVVVDGRQEGLSAGMTLKELASLMKDLGCQEAMNLDGGGSSTLWLGGKVMNSPSDGRERSVANGLVVLRKNKTKQK